METRARRRAKVRRKRVRIRAREGMKVRRVGGGGEWEPDSRSVSEVEDGVMGVVASSNGEREVSVWGWEEVGGIRREVKDFPLRIPIRVPFWLAVDDQVVPTSSLA